MSGDGKHIDRFESVQATNDRDAIAVAKLYRGSWPLELWFGASRVEAFAASAVPALRHPN